jgi:hypothetical protein
VHVSRWHDGEETVSQVRVREEITRDTLPWFIAIASLAHLSLVWWWVHELETSAAVDRPLEVLVELVQPMGLQPLHKAVDEVELPTTPVSHASGVENGPPRPVRRRLGSSKEVQTGTRLDLQTPLATVLKEDGELTNTPIELRPAFARALEKRRQEQARNQRTAMKRIERLGLDESAYNAIDPMSGHMKTAKGCFDVRHDMMGDAVGLMGFEQRFWMSGCRDGRRDSPDRFFEAE